MTLMRCVWRRGECVERMERMERVERGCGWRQGRVERVGGERNRHGLYTRRACKWRRPSRGGVLTSRAASAAASGAAVSDDIHLPALFHTLFPSRSDKRVLLLCLLTNVLSVMTYVVVAPCLGNVIDVISASPRSSYGELARAVGMLGLAYVLSNTTLAAQVQLASSVGERLAKSVRGRLFYGMMMDEVGEKGRAGRTSVGDATMPTTMPTTTRTTTNVPTTGSRLSWLTNDIGVLQATVTKLLGARGIRSGLETIAIIGVLLYLNWVLALVLLVSAPVLTPLVLSAAKTIKVLSADVQEAVGRSAAAAVEIIENQKVIKANQGEAGQVARYDALVEAQSGSNTQLIVFQSLLDVSGRLRNVFCVLLTVGLGAHLALMNQVTVGTCYSFFIYGFGFAFALSNVAQSVGESSKVVGALKSCYKVLGGGDGGVGGDGESMSSVHDEHHHHPILDEETLEVEFRNVSFSHPDGWTMRDISFTMPAGTTTALVGPSGSGKSTIASLLLGFHEPTSGDILVNGVPLSSIDVGRWRSVVGVVEQKAGLLVGKVKDVVRYGNEHMSDDEVAEVLEAAQALEFVERLGGIDEWISSGNGNDTLSGGQGQRLALARALARRPKLLVLDEATSALDTETESKLELQKGDRQTTSMVIAHRLTTVRDCDNIVVVKGGRIVAQGAGDAFFEREVVRGVGGDIGIGIGVGGDPRRSPDEEEEEGFYSGG